MSAHRHGKGSLLAVDAIGVSICIALTGLAYVGAVRPHSTRALELAARQAELAGQTSEARQLAASESALAKRLQAGRQTLTDEALPLDDAGELNRRLARTGDLAADCGVDIDEIRVEDSASQTHYQTVPLGFKGRAGFDAAIAFLRRLHDTAPDTGIWSFKLSGNPREPDAPTTCEFDLTWYAAAADDS